MNIRKYYLKTEATRQHINPGDVWIGKGIEYLIRQAEAKLHNLPIFNYLYLHEYPDFQTNVWKKLLDDADYFILAGVPQLEAQYVPIYFDNKLYKLLAEAKKKDIVLANLWMGIVHATQDYAFPNSVNRIVQTHDSFMKANYPIFDLIVSRDNITKATLDSCSLENTRFTDSAIYALMYYGITPNKNKCVNVIVPRNIGGYNDRIAKIIPELKKQFSKNHPVFILVHSVTDYLIYKILLPEENILAINTPNDLALFYNNVHEMVSFRVHGTAIAMQLGAKVMNVKMDSRSDIITSNFNVPSYSLEEICNNPTFKGHTHSIQLEKDEERFIGKFHEKCQKKHGQKKIREAQAYTSEDYWTGKGISTYTRPLVGMTTPNVQKICVEVSTLKFKCGLDLGCASGYVVNYMNKQKHDFYGIDVSEYAIKYGKKYFPHLKDKLFVGSAHDLSVFEDNKFDLVYSQQVLEHIPTELVKDLCMEMRRVCKPGATLILYLVIGFGQQIARARNDVDVTHWNLKVKSWWEEQFAQVGFTPDKELDQKLEQLVPFNQLHRLVLKKSFQ